MTRRAIALCFILGLVSCTKPSPTDARTEVLVRILDAEDSRQWDRSVEDLLGNPDPVIRARAALAAGRIGDVAALPRLADLLNKRDEEEAVVAMAAFAIGEMEAPEGAAPLLAAVRDSTPTTAKGAAIEGLGKIAAALPENESRNRKQIGAAILDALQGPQPDGQFTLLALTAALRAKPQGGPAAVAAFLKSNDPRVREDALNVLARLRSKESITEVRALLHDPDPLTRANAARVLGAAEDKASLAELSSLIAADPDPRVRIAAIRALASIASPSSAAVLLNDQRPLAGSEGLERVTALGRVLANTGNADAIARLASLRQAGRVAPEIEIAFARIAPGRYLVDPAVQRPAGGWRQVSAIAQALAEIVPSGERATALDIVQRLAQSSETPEQSMADVLQALKALQSPRLQSIARMKLQANDGVTRATAADILAELAPSAETTAALSAALRSTTADKQNDAALSIVGALGKSMDSAATAALLEAASAPDHLVRRKAIDALKGRAGVSAPQVGRVSSKNKREDYMRALGRIGKQPKAVITTDKGAVTIQFYPDDAPLTVDSFIQLAQAHFFDGLTFHRVVGNFVIQGGDPRGDGNGGPGYTLRCEINGRRYDTGAVGMALSGKDTGGSQFFITHSPQPHLDGGYTVFAHVIAGQDVVDRIERGDRVERIAIQE